MSTFSSFRTEIHLSPSAWRISHKTPLFFLGSCFSENIGTRFTQAKFSVTQNPFGILYHPASLREALEQWMEKDFFQPKDLSSFGEYWFSFQHHSDFKKIQSEDCLSALNQALEFGRSALKNAHFLVLTFGTAWGFRLKSTGAWVANCHKLPANHFEKSCLKLEEIVASYLNFLPLLKQWNPQLNIIFTLSPIRHWKEGAIENQYSKAILLIAIHQIKSQLSFVDYFPAYELMMDDLRDYRFYEADLLHPNEQAIAYIWELFLTRYCTQETRNLIEQIRSFQKGLEHRSFIPQSQSHQDFLKKQQEQLEVLEKKYPFLSFQTEREQLTSAKKRSEGLTPLAQI